MEGYTINVKSITGSPVGQTFDLWDSHIADDQTDDRLETILLSQCTDVDGLKRRAYVTHLLA